MLQLFNDEVKRVYDKVCLKYTNNGHFNRFTHIEGVCKMATHLAKIYNVDIKKAQICALVHDYYKYESNEELRSLIDKEDILICEECEVLYHSFASANALLNEFGIDDNEMKNAIKYHVFGHTSMTKLEEIILISDYTEENRTYKDCIEVRDILLSGNLDLAIYESTKRVINFLVNRNIKPHPMQYEVLNEYERKVSNGKN